jgi:hypothetical protein
MSDVPELPDGLTPAYITHLLREDGCLSATGSITHVRQERVGDGTGMSSELARLYLTYEGDRGQAPDTVIAKFLPRNEVNRASATAFNLPEREVRYARELDPLTDAVTPRTYACLLQSDRFLLMMEDLGDYRIGSQLEGATLAETELAIDELAKLHSAFWNRVDDFDWVPGIANSYHADVMCDGCRSVGWDNMVQNFEVPEYVRQHRDDFLASIPELQSHRMAPPVTLVHGDFRMENVMYGEKPGHHPIVVFDWQGPLKARGMFDVSLFLTQSTRTEVRRSHEKALLERYLERLKSGGVTDVDWNFIWEDYLRCTLYDWLYTAVVAGTLDTSNEIARGWMTKMIERHAAASEDHDVFQFLPGKGAD